MGVSEKPTAMLAVAISAALTGLTDRNRQIAQPVVGTICYKLGLLRRSGVGYFSVRTRGYNKGCPWEVGGRGAPAAHCVRLARGLKVYHLRAG